jgi:hypothetical protein
VDQAVVKDGREPLSSWPQQPDRQPANRDSVPAMRIRAVRQESVDLWTWKMLIWKPGVPGRPSG